MTTNRDDTLERLHVLAGEVLQAYLAATDERNLDAANQHGAGQPSRVHGAYPHGAAHQRRRR